MCAHLDPARCYHSAGLLAFAELTYVYKLFLVTTQLILYVSLSMIWDTAGHWSDQRCSSKKLCRIQT